MQRAELEIHNEDSRFRIRADDVTGKLEGVDRGIAAHETDDGALDRRRQPAALDELKIKTRCGEASAASYEEMGEPVAFAPEFEPVNGCRGKPRGLGGKQPHARRRAREPAADIEGGRVELRRIVLRRGRQERIAALDTGFFGHAPEYSPLATIFWKQRFGKANKACVHIVRRYRGRYAVDVGARHEVPLPFKATLQAHQLFGRS